MNELTRSIMPFFKKTQIENLRVKPSSFFCLNTAQFLGALNDCIYKLLTIFFLISVLGAEKSNTILSAAGAIYVVPFLLFSVAAGVLADKFSKQKIIIVLKGAEIVILLFALFVFQLKNVWGCYALLFLLATHSAILGPCKYGIIPEVVKKEKIAKANSIITSFTYLSIIIGTFFASFLTEITNYNYLLSASVCLAFALCGFIASFGINKTNSGKSVKKIRVFFVREIIQTILGSRKIALLTPCLFGSAFFLFIGAFTQLNIIPFAIQALQLSEYAGGYLFLLCAIGIAGGALLAGKILKKGISLGVSCLTGFVISILFCLLWLFSSFLIPTITIIILLGITGGIFIVPFDSFIQIYSSPKKRGQTIATANFLGFCGILIASFCLYFFGNILKLSAATGFLYMGLITFLCALFLTARLLATTLPFFSQLLKTKKTSLKNVENIQIFIIKDFRWALLWKAAALSFSCLIFIQKRKNQSIPFLLYIAPNVSFLPEDISLEDAMIHAKKMLKKEEKAYLFHEAAFSIKQKPLTRLSLQEEVGLLSLKKGKKRQTLTLKRHYL
ncbi:MAG: MFS transporter [Rhabdochlamydiaceae bacterium]|nr:MFS transporter [Rhabdochlamydiaceae bacterium]